MIVAFAHTIETIGRSIIKIKVIYEIREGNKEGDPWLIRGENQIGI